MTSRASQCQLQSKLSCICIITNWWSTRIILLELYTQKRISYSNSKCMYRIVYQYSLSCFYTYIARYCIQLKQQNHTAQYQNNTWKHSLFALEFTANVVGCNLVPVYFRTCDWQGTTKGLKCCLAHCFVVVHKGSLQGIYMYTCKKLSSIGIITWTPV